MPFDTHLFVGVDPCGGRKPFTYAALDKRGRLVFLGEGELEAVLAYLGGLRAALVAVNAPPRPNQGLVRRENGASGTPVLFASGRVLNLRLVEYQLHEHGINIAHTPAFREYCPNWTQLGFEFYRRIEAMGFRQNRAEPLELGWLETNPHATYCALLSQVPLGRTSLEGRLQRQLALHEQGLGIRDPMDFFEELTRYKLLKGNLPLDEVYTSEQLDALAAACTAWMLAHNPERTSRLGDEQEGQILLPVSALKEKY